jgi:hypothetical protein
MLWFHVVMFVLPLVLIGSAFVLARWSGKGRHSVERRRSG